MGSRAAEVSFQQQCNQPYCKWQNATADRFRMLVEYQCDTSDLLGSPWAPFPLFDRAEDMSAGGMTGMGCV